MSNEFIPYGHGRLVGVLSIVDAERNCLDVGLAYGQRGELGLVISCADTDAVVCDVILSMPDARALRDFLNRLNLDD